MKKKKKGRKEEGEEEERKKKERKKIKGRRRRRKEVEEEENEEEGKSEAVMKKVTRCMCAGPSRGGWQRCDDTSLSSPTLGEVSAIGRNTGLARSK